MARERYGFEVLFAGDTRRDPEFLAELGKVETEFADAIAGLIVVDGIDHEHQLLLAYGIVGIAETTCRHWIRRRPAPAARRAGQGGVRPGLGRPARPPRRLRRSALLDRAAATGPGAQIRAQRPRRPVLHAARPHPGAVGQVVDQAEDQVARRIDRALALPPVHQRRDDRGGHHGPAGPPRRDGGGQRPPATRPG